MIQGKWYREGGAVQLSATLRSADGVFSLDTETGETHSGDLSDIQVPTRLGNVERKLTLPDGSIFATSDNDAVDHLFKKQIGFGSVIHTFEAHMGLVAFALVATLAFSFVFIKWGIPWASSTIAHALPHKTNELIGEGALEFLDKHLFEESQIHSKRKEQIKARFETHLVALVADHPDIHFSLHFRAWNHGEQAIPNALALPSGDIILTDKFIELSENQAEIDAVLLHEIGHVVHRHSLQMVIQGAIVTTVVMMATGDNSALVDLGLGIVSLLVSSNYSRGHEFEADLYAFEKMLIAKIDPIAFSNILSRMSEYMDAKKGNEEESDVEQKESSKDIRYYLYSHPSDLKRKARAEKYSECFRNSLLICR